ncbi:MAG: hypothetical protein Q4C65_05645 [Eubacteriales bacterium]|nr:hypothetical protein [Eubacteriales bacterium]
MFSEWKNPLRTAGELRKDGVLAQITDGGLGHGYGDDRVSDQGITPYNSASCHFALALSNHRHLIYRSNDFRVGVGMVLFDVTEKE